MARNYFVCSVGKPEPAPNWIDKVYSLCLNQKIFVLVANGKRGSISKISPDDILFLKYRKRLVAYGVAVSSVQTDQDFSEDLDEDGMGWDHRIDVANWIPITPGITYVGIQKAQIGGTAYDTVKQVNESFGLNRLKAMGG